MRTPSFSRVPLAALAAAAAGAALLALQGAEWHLWLGWGLAAAAALPRHRDHWCLAAVAALLLPQAGLRGPAATAAVALSAGLVFCSKAGLAGRAVALAGGLAVFLEGGSKGLEPYLSLLVLTAVLPRPGARRALILAGMAAVPLLGDLPRPSAPGPRVLQEVYRDGGTSWEEPASVYAGEAELLLRCAGPGVVHLDLGSGGVRDAGPVGLVVTDRMALPVHPGRDTLSVEQTEGWVIVTMERSHAPGTHPVVRLYGAWTGEGP